VTANGVDVDAVRAFVARAAEHAGLPAQDVPLFVESLVEADLRGIDTHGIVRVPAYVRGFKQGLINPRPNITTLRRRGAVAVLDADNGLGGIVGQRAMDLAMELATASGVGVVAVRDSNHAGMLAQHVIRASNDGLIGYFVSNGPAVMPAWGGRDPAISNNPVAWAFPRTDADAIVFDMACSAIARGKLRRAALNDEEIPLGWAVDEDGNPTTDPHAGMRGLVLPMAAHKGYGLAVVNELLSVALSGALYSFEVSRAFLAEGATALDSWRVGHLAMAFDIEAFVDRGHYDVGVTRFADMLKSSAPAPGFDEVLLPGEIESRLRSERLAVGLPVPGTTLRLLDQAAAEFGIPTLTEAAR
jgi:LDH2 family malate/lactate/ureidoglycolate dehydrogenase